MKWIKDWFQRRRDEDDIRVMKVFIAKVGARHYALEVCEAAGMTPGTVQPALMRLRNGGWLDSGWDEDPIPGTDLRRRWYQISDKAIGVGEAVLKAENGS